jgi:cytochrome c oxidase assembly protein subunit 15
MALVAVCALTLTIISGAAVRLTGSGLGCPNWPDCTATSIVAPLRFHAWVEFANRLINAAVSVASIGMLAAALLRRPRRRDLTWLSAAMVLGLAAEVVIGGIVVLTKLDPVVVSIHFLVGLAFLAVAVILHQRSKLLDSAPPARPMVGKGQIALARLAMAALVVVASLGTVVTSSGPHGGSPGTPRDPFSLHSVAQLHGSSAEVFLAITLAMLWSLSRSSAPRPVINRGLVMLLALGAQAAIGYTQYFSGDPVGIVALHVAGASLLVIAAVQYYMGLWSHPAASVTPLADDPAAERERVGS